MEEGVWRVCRLHNSALLDQTTSISIRFLVMWLTAVFAMERLRAEDPVFSSQSLSKSIRSQLDGKRCICDGCDAFEWQADND